jgi:hypothetical protein
MFLVVVVLISFNAIAVSAEEPNVGTLRVYSFRTPREVAPNSVFSVHLGVEYALHNRPENATIRAVIYRGDVNFTAPFWQSDPEIVTRGGEKIWDVNLTSPLTEGYLKLTAYAYYLDEGAWRFFNNSLNGPGFRQVTIKIEKTTNLHLELGMLGVPVSIDNMTVKTSSNGDAQITLFVGNTYVVSVPYAVEYQNLTRMIFSGWNDGINQTKRTVVLDGDMKLVGSYRLQYLLQVNSLISSYSEWYDAGSNVKLQTPTSIPMDWPLGLLGAKYNFVGWTGGIISSVSQVDVTMNAPKTLTANYSVDYAPVVASAIFASGVAGAVVLFLTRRRGKVLDQVVSSGESTLRCSNCAEVVEKTWTYCDHCGRDLTLSASDNQ